jgi:uncharacterized metal-binding protein/predicted Fe-Mo cluster-binding NifX family protein
MVVGVAVYEGRVAPRCVCADGLLLVNVRRGRVRDWRTLPVAVDTPLRLAEVLRRHDVATFVCGGLQRDAREALEDQGIDIVDNVACSAGEAVQALEAGTLRDGYGFGRADSPAAEPPPRPSAIDCLACDDRRCQLGQACPALGSTLPLPDTGADAAAVAEMLEAAADISAEPERRLCRLAELVYFCLEMGHGTIGVAYCTELTEPAEILTRVLRRFFDVVPVCCKICAPPPSEGRGPLVQAAVLNEAGTDLNVVVGLCIGVDCVFAEASRAPVTTLFVKDRSLANNPIGAVYSEYHIRESVAPGSPHAARVARGRSRAGTPAASEAPEEER